MATSIIKTPTNMKSIFTRSLVAILTTFFALPLFAAPPFRVENVVRVKGLEETTIQGLGIVSGLNASGDDAKSYGPTAKAALRILQSLGQPDGTLKEIGTSKNNALVRITVKIPAAGARGGDILDCTVVSIGNAKSLEYGHLTDGILVSPIAKDPDTAEVLGMAFGNLTLENPAAKNNAKVKGGARLTADFINPYIKDGLVTLVIKPEYARNPHVAEAVARAINELADAAQVTPQTESFDDFDSGSNLNRAPGTKIATAINPSYVVVKVDPEGYYANPMQFVSEILQRPLSLDEVPRIPSVFINERTGGISIDDEVEVRPTVITHKNIVAQVQPQPVPPPGQLPLNPEQFVELDQPTILQNMQGTPTQNMRLKALQIALNNVRVRPEDMIEIIKLLHKQGNIIGEVVYEQ